MNHTHTQTQRTKNTQLSTQTGNQQQASVLLYKAVPIYG